MLGSPMTVWGDLPKASQLNSTFHKWSLSITHTPLLHEGQLGGGQAVRM